MRVIAENYSHIKGWSVDVDLKNDPTYPMKHRTDEEHAGYSWERPTQQEVNVEILHSNERFNVTAVFGTSVPPNGLSGIIRRFAFRYGESSYGHWLPLILADRVNVVEGIVDDIRHGFIPNIFAERGMMAYWKYDKIGLLKKFLLRVTITSAMVAWVYNKNKRKAILQG